MRDRFLLGEQQQLPRLLSERDPQPPPDASPQPHRNTRRAGALHPNPAHTLEEPGPGRQALLTNREDHADCGLLCGCAAAEPAAEHVLRLRDLGVSRHSHRCQSPGLHSSQDGSQYRAVAIIAAIWAAFFSSRRQPMSCRCGQADVDDRARHHRRLPTRRTRALYLLPSSTPDCFESS